MQHSWLVTGINLSLSHGIAWYVVAACLAGIAAYLVYRYTLPPVSRIRRTLLWVLRGTALALLLLLLCEPVLSYLWNRDLPPTVALLVDTSASMSITSESEDRRSSLQTALSSRGIRDVASRSKLRVFSFSDTTVEISADSVIKLTPAGIGTDISGAWTAVQRKLADENFAAAIVISDGAHTIGENPVRVAAGSSFPIYTIGVGDTNRRRDAVIGEILTNEVVYAGVRVPIDIRVRAQGLGGKATVLSLIDERGQVLGRESVRFAGEDDEVTTSLAFKADFPGEMRVTAVLDSFPGEVSLKNNRRSVIIKVLESRSRILLIAGAPSPDVAALRQSLESDTSFEVLSFVEGPSGRLLYGVGEPDAEMFAQAKAIVLVDYPTRNSGSSLLSNILRSAEEKSTPIFFFAGPNVSSARLTSLEGLLAVNPARSTLSEERMILRGGGASSVLSGGATLPADWSELPPVLGGNGNFQLEPGTQIVAKMSREALGIAEEEPAVVIWEANRKRGAAVLCWNVNRWRLQLAGSPGATFHEDFVRRVISWLVAPAEERRVKIRTGKRLYSGGERVRIVGEVYGADLTPRSDASIEVQVTSGDRKEVVSLRSKGDGRYEGEFIPWSEGDYRFAGTAMAGGDSLGTDRGLFTVEAFNIELLEPRARYDILEGIATASRGGFAPFEDMDSLLATIPLAARRVESRSEVPLWNRGLLFWIAIILLSVEWIVRKRSGML